MDIAGRSVFHVARPAFVSRQRAQRLASRAGASPGTGRPGRGSVAVYGLDGAISRLQQGSLIADWERLRLKGIEPVSEIGFLRSVGILPKVESARLIAADNFRSLSGLDERTVLSLAIAGAIEPEGNQYPFGDVRLGREISRLLDHGHSLAGIAAAAAVARRHEGARMAAADTDIAVRLNESEIEISGQTMLPFGDAPADLNDVLDQAEEAEEARDFAAAHRLYETAVMARPRDAAIRYNLGCTLLGLSSLDEAEIQFRMAASLDPLFAEAHFNIAYIRRMKSDVEGERRALQRTIAADPNYVEAMVDLVRWFVAREAFGEVRSLVARIQAIGTPEPQQAFIRKATILCELSEQAGSEPRH